MPGTLSGQSRSAVAAVLIALVWSTAAEAQASSGRGYLFGKPKGSLTLRGGYSAPAAGSDLFDFVTSELTINRSDFGAVSGGADFAIRVRPRWDLVLSYDGSGMAKQSEFREWEDSDGRPIEQTTTFSRDVIAMNVKYYLLPDGRSLGRFAWVSTTYAPWVSAGFGRMHYQFRQKGDFIDFERGNDVFRDEYNSSQWTNTWQLTGGLDWNLSHRFALTSQARYLFAKADLQRDFSGFDPIDLSGLAITAGLSIRF